MLWRDDSKQAAHSSAREQTNTAPEQERKNAPPIDNVIEIYAERKGRQEGSWVPESDWRVVSGRHSAETAQGLGFVVGHDLKPAQSLRRLVVGPMERAPGGVEGWRGGSFACAPSLMPLLRQPR